jgi:hypothetical protein
MTPAFALPMHRLLRVVWRHARRPTGGLTQLVGGHSRCPRSRLRAPVISNQIFVVDDPDLVA